MIGVILDARFVHLGSLNIFEMGLGQSHYIRDKSVLVSTSVRHSLTIFETNAHFRPYCLIIFETRHLFFLMKILAIS